LLFGSNPANAVVATGVATYFPLRTAEKSNSNSLIPLTSVVAGNKARSILRCNTFIAVVTTGVANDLSLRTAEKRNP
jgi:hypothetical protein